MRYNERLFVRVEIQSIGDEIIKISREHGMAAKAINFVAHELRQGAIAESRIFAGGQALDLLLASVGLESLPVRFDRAHRADDAGSVEVCPFLS